MLKGVVSRVDAQIYVHSRSKGVAHDTLKLAAKGSSHRSPESLMNPRDLLNSRSQSEITLEYWHLYTLYVVFFFEWVLLSSGILPQKWCLLRFDNATHFSLQGCMFLPSGIVRDVYQSSRSMPQLILGIRVVLPLISPTTWSLGETLGNVLRACEDWQIIHMKPWFLVSWQIKSFCSAFRMSCHLTGTNCLYWILVLRKIDDLQKVIDKKTSGSFEVAICHRLLQKKEVIKAFDRDEVSIKTWSRAGVPRIGVASSGLPKAQNVGHLDCTKCPGCSSRQDGMFWMVVE